VMRFFVDGALYHEERATRLPAGARWVFDHPFFVVLDLAVGGTFGGPPDDSTPFPALLVVDSVSVYAR
jgi:beta-glucanase (GH16 family)